ncbi:MAG TPA: YbaB/EbfC family nucleoid-associated protein [Candidatus Limiplasma sp.]|nr:YbaB/EbfC family nucleoid-associated protein [Candidatus Limiplasma sp.]
MARNQFNGFGGGGNMQQLMRQAQKLQEQMVKTQQELEEREYTAQAGGGMVSVVASGKGELKSVTINPECVDPDDVEMLQDMVLAAVNEAIRMGQEAKEAEMGKLSPGMGGMF